YTNKNRNRLFIYDKRTNDYISITDTFTNVEHFILNDDRTKVAIITSSFMDKASINNELYIYDIGNNLLEKISPMDDFDYSYCAFLNDKLIFIGSEGKDYGLNENPHIY